jgi:hypothetical protein
MRTGDQLRVSVLRTTLAAVANAEAVDAATSVRPRQGAFAGDVPRRELSEDDVRSIVAAARDELRTAEDELRGLGQADAADDLSAQAGVLEA